MKADQDTRPGGAQRVLVLSPHLDDAVFSCGELLASLPGALVATVFAGRPPRGACLTEWDRAAGFRPGDDVVGARRAEDRHALGLLGARPFWLRFRDRQYGGGAEPEAVARAVRILLLHWRPRMVLFPLGLFHSDHGLVRDAALMLCRQTSGLLWLAYEDALYRALDGLRDEQLGRLQADGFSVRPQGFPAAPHAPARKAAAVACYRSQLRALATPGRPGLQDLLREERYWRLAAVAAKAA